MQHSILAGTHQKTGTVWVNSVFKGLAVALGAPFYNVSRMDDESFAPVAKELQRNPTPCVLFDNHTAFPEACFSLDHRGFHMVRDPRDMVISAVKYHENTDAKFANKPLKIFDGMSLREKINSLPDLESKIAFEIESVMVKNISDIISAHENENFISIKYETIISDHNLIETPQLLTWLGLGPVECVIGLCIFWQESLFGLKSRGDTTHIRNGAPRQYLSVYNEPLHEAFDRTYPTVLQQLGYDRDLTGQPLLPHPVQIDPLTAHAARKLSTLRDVTGIDGALTEAGQHCDDPAWPLASYSRYRLSAGDIISAGRYAWMALEQNDMSAHAMSALGDAALADGDLDGACRFLETAAVLSGGSEKHVAALIDAQLANNIPEAAQNWLKIALRQYPKSKPLTKLERRIHQEIEDGKA